MNDFFQKQSLKAVGLIFLSSLIVLLGWGLLNQNPTSPVLAQTSSSPTLTVTGMGKKSIETTLTQVNLGVEIEGVSAKQVQETAAQRSTAVVELLRERNVNNLETTGLRLQPQYNYSNGERRLQGYQALNLVSFRLPTSEMGNLLDEAVKAGATRIDSVSFTATDAAITAAQKDALQAATRDAKAQADAVLETLNLRSQGVMNIQINNANPPMTSSVQALRTRGDMGESAAASSPVVGGEQEIEARVTLQISY